MWNEVAYSTNTYSTRQSFYLLTLLPEKREAILLKTRLIHVLLMKEKSVV